MSASPADVWDVDWPTWYPNLSNVRIQDGSRELSQGVDFTWNTFGGYRVYSQIRADEWLAWDARDWSARLPRLIIPHQTAVAF